MPKYLACRQKKSHRTSVLAASTRGRQTGRVDGPLAAASQKLRPINSTLNALEGDMFICAYALDPGPFGPAWVFLEFICHHSAIATRTVLPPEILDRSKRNKICSNDKFFADSRHGATFNLVAPNTIALSSESCAEYLRRCLEKKRRCAYISCQKSSEVSILLEALGTVRIIWDILAYSNMLAYIVH